MPTLSSPWRTSCCHRRARGAPDGPITFEHVTKRFDETTAVDDLSIEVADGEFLVLVGPSGCGKTTALRMLAGLEEITSGRILIGDRVVNNVAPGARDVAMVFQSYALYPHMTVYDNLAFSLRNHRVPKERDRPSASRRTADMLELADLLKRKPKQLSGGQRQRVALGRAIVREPEAFLMDEPLSNLDAALRVQTRAEILKLQQRLGTTTIYVTHDQVEAMTMGDRIAVMNKGVLQQIGTPEELYDASRQHVRRAVHRLARDEHAAAGRARRRRHRAARRLPARARPARRTGVPDRAVYEASVEVVEYLGDEQLAHLRLGDHEIVVKLPVEPRLRAGERRDVLGAAATRCCSSMRRAAGPSEQPPSALSSRFSTGRRSASATSAATSTAWPPRPASSLADTRFLSRCVADARRRAPGPLSHDHAGAAPRLVRLRNSAVRRPPAERARRSSASASSATACRSGSWSRTTPRAASRSSSALELEADFADIFVVKDLEPEFGQPVAWRSLPSRAPPERAGNGTLVFSDERVSGADGGAFLAAVRRVEGGVVRFALSLEPGAGWRSWSACSGCSTASAAARGRVVRTRAGRGAAAGRAVADAIGSAPPRR